MPVWVMSQSDMMFVSFGVLAVLIYCMIKIHKKNKQDLKKNTKFLCPECKAPCDASMTECPVCKTHFNITLTKEHATPNVLKGEYFCPVCHAVVSKNMQFCTGCGKPLDYKKDKQKGLYM